MAQLESRALSKVQRREFPANYNGALYRILELIEINRDVSFTNSLS
jgi:hypothetical protein